MTKSLVCAIAASAWVVSCVSAIPHPSEDDAAVARRTYPGTTTEDLQHGRKLYVAKCSGCHHLHPPGDRTAAEWPKWVETMAARSSLRASDQTAIERYLSTMARDRTLEAKTRP